MRIFRVAKCDIELLGLGWGLELDALAFSLSTLAFTSLRSKVPTYLRKRAHVNCDFGACPISAVALSGSR